MAKRAKATHFGWLGFPTLAASRRPGPEGSVDSAGFDDDDDDGAEVSSKNANTTHPRTARPEPEPRGLQSRFSLTDLNFSAMNCTSVYRLAAHAARYCTRNLASLFDPVSDERYSTQQLLPIDNV
uniref:Uncharacterized protein n=1 Tax=Oryza glumipatula TaxID=40148 RepID=A0A0E0A0L9_9ORYZ